MLTPEETTSFIDSMLAAGISQEKADKFVELVNEFLGPEDTEENATIEEFPYGALMLVMAKTLEHFYSAHIGALKEQNTALAEQNKLLQDKLAIAAKEAAETVEALKS